MDRWRGKVAIVTGASVGIGAALVEALVNEGLKVVGLARRVGKMEELASSLKDKKGTLDAVQCDVSKEEDILKAFKIVEEKFGGLDILVNNAGVLFPSSIIEGPTEHFRQILDVNVFGVSICTREAVRLMRKSPSQGHIININSVAGHNAELIMIPISIYAASKFAVTGLTDSVRNEIAAANLNIKITSVSPGAVETDMINKLDVPSSMVKLASADIVDGILYVLSTPPRVQVKELTIAPFNGS
ncbi:farnesol dehydrogenase-like [Cephus cinctus]|uniref:Farnesol dehydrogenase-like n=1 Tax=Cephus cinctus TaxID=211228 RepID=A0AAJ7C437_CEPCN|nr:farnesol dehydrogenase-like [Cephus cinctus]